MLEQDIQNLTSAIIGLTKAILNTNATPEEKLVPEEKPKPEEKQKTKPGPKKKAPEPEPEPEEDFFGEEEPEITFDMIREVAIKVAKLNKREEMMGILAELGATKLPDLDKSAYCAAYKQLSLLAG